MLWSKDIPSMLCKTPLGGLLDSLEPQTQQILREHTDEIIDHVLRSCQDVLNNLPDRDQIWPDGISSDTLEIPCSDTDRPRPEGDYSLRAFMNFLLVQERTADDAMADEQWWRDMIGDHTVRPIRQDDPSGKQRAAFEYRTVGGTNMDEVQARTTEILERVQDASSYGTTHESELLDLLDTYFTPEHTD